MIFYYNNHFNNQFRTRSVKVNICMYMYIINIINQLKILNAFFLNIPKRLRKLWWNKNKIMYIQNKWMWTHFLFTFYWKWNLLNFFIIRQGLWGEDAFIIFLESSSNDMELLSSSLIRSSSHNITSWFYYCNVVNRFLIISNQYVFLIYWDIIILQIFILIQRNKNWSNIL